jgi:hypothetical protein
MQKKHLSRDQLTAFRDGALEDRRAMEHLVSCPDCQRAFDDSRWLLALARIRKDVAKLEHPDRDELTGYLSQALSSRRAGEIARHLRMCDSCLARYRRMRRAEAASDYSSPAPALLRATQRRFRSRPRIRELGALILAKAGDAFAVLHRPAPGLASGEMAPSFLGPVDEMQERSPAPPERRRDRRASEVRREQRLCKARERAPDRIAEQDDAVEKCLSAAPPAKALGPSPGSFAVVEAGPLALVFDAGLEDGQPVLSVLALDRESGDPRAGLVVVIESEDGARNETITTKDRTARLALQRGASTLLVRDRETYRLTIDLPG